MSVQSTSLDDSAKALLDKYFDVMSSFQFKRSLLEFRQDEINKLDRLRLLYASQPIKARFLKPEYFRDFDKFEMRQLIPEQYFVDGCQRFDFVSHRWESPHHPDPTGRQFRKYREYIERSYPKGSDHYTWYDFSCLPQNTSDTQRSPIEQDEFESSLQIMHLLTTFSHTVVLLGKGYLNRSWCIAEWMFATSISPVLLDEDQPFPFGNAIKFRQIAILIMYMMLDDEFKKEFILGKDDISIAFLNSLLRRTIESTDATYSSDKHYLSLVLHRHFWYHVRYLGLTNQLAIAALTLATMDKSQLDYMFKSFLVITEDLDLEWTREASFELDTMILDQKDPFTDMRFHGVKIERLSSNTVKDSEDSTGSES